MRTWIAALALVAGSVAVAHAQTAAQDGFPDPVLSRLDESDSGPNGYAYDADGRRDPFVDLRVSSPPPPGTPVIEELALRGIVKTRQGWSAMLVLPGGRALMVSLGTRLYDGEVVAIDGEAVVFRQQVTDPLSPPKAREVRKALRP